MTVENRILITSKRPAELLPLRKPIKGCYCNQEIKKIQYRSTRTICKPNWPCDYCKSNLDCRISTPQNDKNNLSPTLSCKTLQKVQRINYTPRSEFLRHVQKKVSQHYSICSGNRSEPVVTSPRLNVCYDSSLKDANTSNELNEKDHHKCVKDNQALDKLKNKKSHKTLRIAQSNSDIDEISDTCFCENLTSTSSRYSKDTRSKSKSRESRSPCRSSFKEQKCVRIPEIQTIFPSSEKSKSKKSQKTICSGRISDNVSSTAIPTKSSSRNKHKSRVLSQKKSCCTDFCPIKDKTKNSSTDKKIPYRGDSDKCCGCLSKLCPALIPQDNSIDQETLELRKFREKNYFDTHGSRQTLLSPSQSSSGSIEQFQLNERLFPQSTGKIHRDDIVVSMPICATKQLKQIHYFPRYIIKQQKNPVPPIFQNKRGRKQSCPLTGHAIDLGVIKVSCPVNSLALKFQKGVAS